MSEYTALITAMEAERDAINLRSASLGTAIKSLRELAGLPERVETPRTAPPTQKRTNERRALATPTAHRSLPDVTPAAHKILAALRAGPTAPGELARVTGFNSSTALRHHLRPLIASGQVIETGATARLRLSLPGAAPATTPAKAIAPPTSPSAASPSSSVSEVEARDKAILARLRKGRATFDELLRVLPYEDLTPDVQAMALKNALRRLTLRKQVADVGVYFQAV